MPPDCYNGLTTNGNVVAQVAGGVADPPMGGAIADGIYDLSQSVAYPPAAPTLVGRSGTIRVTGNMLDIVNLYTNTTTPGPSYATYTFTTSETIWMWTAVCGPVRNIHGYTATANTLTVLYPGGSAWTGADTFIKR
jgi:hypothetical protein